MPARCASFVTSACACAVAAKKLIRLSAQPSEWGLCCCPSNVKPVDHGLDDDAALHELNRLDDDVVVAAEAIDPPARTLEEVEAFPLSKADQPSQSARRDGRR
jgi:hypothetical protein